MNLPDQSFYELFATSNLFDLNNSGMTVLRAGSGWLTIPLVTTYVAPSATAVPLPAGDDVQSTVTLSAPMPYGRSGLTTTLNVCSNGYVSTGDNGTSFTPTPANLLNATHASWRVMHDFNSSRAGSGLVKFEEIAGIAYITWDGVLDFSTASTTPSTFQFQFEVATGTCHFVWQTMSTGGNGYLVGFSDAGASSDPGSMDLSAAVPTTFAGNFGVLPLTLTASGNPVQSTVINLVTNNITPTTPFGAVVLSLAQFNPGIDLTSIGMAGCEQYQGGDVTLLFLPMGANSAPTPFNVPAFVGFHIYAQSFTYDPASGLTILGALASNALDLGIGTL